ncbi:MAG: hypothetical protein M3N18_10615 [Actinomycetota bacterium]|nr:hypothetical protein [Actinomycetota bacterium]
MFDPADLREIERLSGNLGALHAKRGRRAPVPGVLYRRRERGFRESAGSVYASGD